MDESQEVNGAAIVACCEAAELLEAIEASLDLVSMDVEISIVGNGDLAAAGRGNDGLRSHRGDLSA